MAIKLEQSLKLTRPVEIRPSDATYPPRLRQGLSKAPAIPLTALGNLALLRLHKTALFCSTRCPGHIILTAYDQSAKWRDTGRCVISGFHSPIERECLQILMRGEQPIIICLARAIKSMRIPTECRAAFNAGRILFLSPFTTKPTRVTKDSAFVRNQLVAALSDDAFIAHISPGGHTEQISHMLRKWRVPIISSS